MVNTPNMNIQPSPSKSLAGIPDNPAEYLRRAQELASTPNMEAKPSPARSLAFMTDKPAEYLRRTQERANTLNMEIKPSPSKSLAGIPDDTADYLRRAQGRAVSIMHDRILGPSAKNLSDSSTKNVKEVVSSVPRTQAASSVPRTQVASSVPRTPVASSVPRIQSPLGPVHLVRSMPDTHSSLEIPAPRRNAPRRNVSSLPFTSDTTSSGSRIIETEPPHELERFRRVDFAPLGTVAPAQINPFLVLPEGVPTPPLISSSWVPGAVIPDSLDFVINQADPPTSKEFLITLPFLSSRRSYYLDTITNSEPELSAYNSFFAETDKSPISLRPTPPAPLAEAVKDAFARLADICDYPSEDLTHIRHDISPQQYESAIMKHAVGTNSKYLFIFTLVQALRDAPKKMLVVVRSARILNILWKMLLHVDVGIMVWGADGPEATRVPDKKPALNVDLCLTTDQELVRNHFDVVIGFDHYFQTSSAAAHHCSSRSSSSNSHSGSAIVLSLVLSYSFEHLNHLVSNDMDPFERLNALVIMVWHGRPLIANLEYAAELLTDDVAASFANYIREPHAGFMWEPLAVPQELLDFYEEAQTIEGTEASDGAGGAKKRKLIADIDEEASKQTRPSALDGSWTSPVLSERVRRLLWSTSDQPCTEPGQEVNVSIQQLEYWSLKLEKLELQTEKQQELELRYKGLIQRLQSQVDGYEKSSSEVQRHYFGALEDRSKFESDSKAATKASEEAARSVDQTRAQVSRVKQQSSKLQARVAELESLLAGSNVSAKLTEQAAELVSAKDQIERLEKQVDSAQSELAYSREAYQGASNAHADAVAEAATLHDQVGALEFKAAATILEAQRLNRESQATDLIGLLREQLAITCDRNLENDRLREELRLLRAARPNNRALSAPRSPRLLRGRAADISRSNSPASMNSSTRHLWPLQSD